MIDATPLLPAGAGFASAAAPVGRGVIRYATAETVVDGWLYSGDLGYVDSDGFYFVVDRAKDMILRGGENVYCAEVEAAIFEHDAVMETATEENLISFNQSLNALVLGNLVDLDTALAASGAASRALTVSARLTLPPSQTSPMIKA